MSEMSFSEKYLIHYNELLYFLFEKDLADWMKMFIFAAEIIQSTV
jgi:hypothetical protein